MGDSGPRRSDHYSPYSPSTSSYRGDRHYEPPRGPRWSQQDWRDREAQSSREGPYSPVTAGYYGPGGWYRQNDSPSSSSSSYRMPGPAPRVAPGPSTLPARPGLPSRPQASPPPSASASASMRPQVRPPPPPTKIQAKAAAKTHATAAPTPPTMRAEDHQPNAEGRSRLRRHHIPTAPPMILPTKRPPPAPLRVLPTTGKRAPSRPKGQSPARDRGNGNSIARPIAPLGRPAMEGRAKPVMAQEKSRAVHQLLPWDRPSEATPEEGEGQLADAGPPPMEEARKRAHRRPRTAPHAHLTKPDGDSGPEEEVFPLEEVLPIPTAEVQVLRSDQDTNRKQERADNQTSVRRGKGDDARASEASKAQQSSVQTPKKTKGQKKAEKRAAAAAAAAAGSASSISAGSPHQAAFTSSSTDEWQPVTPPLSKLTQKTGTQVISSPLPLPTRMQLSSSDEQSSSGGLTKAQHRTAMKAAKKQRKSESVASRAAAEGREVDAPKAKKTKKDDRLAEDGQPPEALQKEQGLSPYPSMSSDPTPLLSPQREPTIKSEVAEDQHNEDAMRPIPGSTGERNDERPALVLSFRDDDSDTAGVELASFTGSKEPASAPSRFADATPTDEDVNSLEAGSQQRQMSVSSDDIPLITTLSRKAAGRSGNGLVAPKEEASAGRYRGTSFGPARSRSHSESTNEIPSSTLRLSSRPDRIDLTGKRQAYLAWRWKWMAMLESQSSLSKNDKDSASSSSALLAITPKGKTSLRLLSAGTASPACSHDLSFPGDINIEAVRRVSSHAVAIASSSNNRVGEGGPQVSLVFAKDSMRQAGPKKSDDDVEMSELTARASAIHLNQRPHITGATSIAPFLPLSDRDALTMVTGGADGAVFAWSYSGSHAKSTNTTRLHALHSGTITALETLPKLDLVVSASPLNQHRAGGATQLVAFDARETKLLHSWKSSDIVAHLSRTTHSRLLDVSLLRADYDQHKLYDLRVPTGGGESGGSTSVSSSSHAPTKPVLSFGWASEYDLPFLGRSAFKSNYCIQGCPDGKVRTWDLRWSSEVLQEVSVGEKGMPISDVLVWDRNKVKGKERTRNTDTQSGGDGGDSGTCVMALSPDAAWRIPLV
ncbi:hypothetical protein BCV69DRAFT_299904 [Microstroma glucosiphilum]|uniref:WD40 repeat-like protein n=1 Tax=Pseudomicrostroma glucosiphilum TaxID=1684307 RepID=A0A316UAU9_9BASI|nr:hypothetical protein BCV69DRAFT_299904 [Pseudomicrostroma glucosiphilum]PWN20165.1 hypothetical protein BCV69DRAFT_299904 [Pseudomicrostroma glucosiphilum]